MAGPAGFARTFREIASSDHRREVLDTLVNELDPYEWRHVKSRLNERTFEFDIVGALPTELVASIFTYLDLDCLLLYRQVSWRWHGILSSPDVVRPSLAQWYSLKDPPLLAAQVLRLEKQDYLKLQTEHLLRFRSAKPYYHAVYDIQLSMDWGSTYGWRRRSFDFCGNNIAWIDESGDPHTNSVRLRNLSTGLERKIVGRGREQLLCLALTEEILAFTTFSGICYVHELKSSVMRTFRLPSLDLLLFTARGRYVACLTIPVYQNSNGVVTDDGNTSTVVVWNFDDQVSHSFRTPHELTLDGGTIQSGQACLPRSVCDTRPVISCLLARRKRRLVNFSRPLLNCLRYDVSV